MADEGIVQVVTPAVQRALRIASQHPAIKSIGDPVKNPDTNTICIELVFEVNFPNAWRVAGESPSGVRLHEPIRFDFPEDFPLKSPAFTLRDDFSRDFAHIQPWLMDGRPEPCIVDGELSEFFQQQGMLGILNQMTVWLERAAEGNLIDPGQGWEPMRHDELDNYIVANPNILRDLVNKQGGHKYLAYDYIRFADSIGTLLLHGQISNNNVTVNKNNLSEIFRESTVSRGQKKIWRGRGLTIFVWPGKFPSGDPIVSDRYSPQFVSTLGDLKILAEEFGCKTQLLSALNWLGLCAQDYKQTVPFSLCIILCGRRPYKLIGTNSPIELCPFIVDIQAPGLFKDGDTTSVTPVGLRHQITPALLSIMSGDSGISDPLPWTLVGAGSLGSKVALHMGRAGRGPSSVIDKSSMSPHNAARHALIPSAWDLQLFWMETKAEMLQEALAGLSQKPKAFAAHIENVLQDKRKTGQAFPQNTWATVNTTASLTVREILTATPIEKLHSRVVDLSLYAQGRVGVIGVEGSNRNPKLGDVIAEFYALCQEDPNLQKIIFSSNNNMQRTVIGEGCGSLTMPMSDGRISVFAAGMSEYLLSRQRSGLPDGCGEILIGCLDEMGLGVSWQAYHLPPITKVTISNSPDWQVHIHQRALEKIEQEVAHWPTAETGGILLGRFSEATGTFNVVDVILPPEDSVRSANEFIIGTKDLRKTLADYGTSCGWALYSLGTWHSHISPGGASKTDYNTAITIDCASLTPTVLLIHTPSGYQAITAAPKG